MLLTLVTLPPGRLNYCPRLRMIDTRQLRSLAAVGNGVKRTSMLNASSSHFDPKATLRRQKAASNFHLPTPSQIGDTVLSRNLWPKIGKSIRRLKIQGTYRAARVPLEGAHKR